MFSETTISYIKIRFIVHLIANHLWTEVSGSRQPNTNKLAKKLIAISKSQTDARDVAQRTVSPIGKIELLKTSSSPYGPLVSKRFGATGSR